MPKLRTLSGDDLLRIFANFGFQPFSQRGSHVKLRRILAARPCSRTSAPSSNSPASRASADLDVD